MSGSRGKRRHHEEEHEEHVNHEAWVIPYADVLTLLMALFLVLWALGDPNAEKTEVAAESFRRELGGGSAGEFDINGGAGAGPLSAGGLDVIEGVGLGAIDSSESLGEMVGDPEEDDRRGTEDDQGPSGTELLTGAIPVDAAVAEFLTDDDPIELDPVTFVPIDRSDEVLGDPLSEVERVVRETAIGSGLSTAVGFRREARGLVVTIVSDSVLFEEGAATVQPDGILILDVIAESLRLLPNSIIIEGHTDSRPISTARYPSNWELSTARATSVLRYLLEVRDLDSGRVAAAGYADTQPLADGDGPEALARNRRVEIVVLATA